LKCPQPFDHVGARETMTPEEIDRRLNEDGIVPVPPEQWPELAEHFEELERHDTFVAGDLVILRGRAGIAALEQPSSTQWVLRSLPSIEEAARFVRERLDQYERMWDGCGCKIDYYK
jgi:hypothetical protein